MSFFSTIASMTYYQIVGPSKIPYGTPPKDTFEEPPFLATPVPSTLPKDLRIARAIRRALLRGATVEEIYHRYGSRTLSFY